MVITATITDEPHLRLVASKTAFTLPHATQSTGRIELIKHAPESKVNFGAKVYGIDLNNFTDADFDFISDALHQHKFLVFKEQPKMLDPRRKCQLPFIIAYTNIYQNSINLLHGKIMSGLAR